MGEGGPKPAGSLCDGLGFVSFLSWTITESLKGLFIQVVTKGGKSFTSANRYVFPTLWPPQSNK